MLPACIGEYVPVGLFIACIFSKFIKRFILGSVIRIRGETILW